MREPPGEGLPDPARAPERPLDARLRGERLRVAPSRLERARAPVPPRPAMAGVGAPRPASATRPRSRAQAPAQKNGGPAAFATDPPERYLRNPHAT